MGEHGLAYRARPHSKAVCELARLRMTSQMLTQRAFIDVAFATNRTWMVCRSPLRQIELIVGRHCLDWRRWKVEID